MIQAVLIMLVAMSLIPAGDTAGKLLTGGGLAAPVFVAWSRFVVGTAAILPFAPPGAWRLLRQPGIWMRGVLIAGGITSIQMALRTEPIADVFAAFFIAPILSYGLSVLFLKEPVTPLRSLLMCLGFIGVLVVVRPGFGGSPGLLWAVLAGGCYGAFLTASRAVSHLGTPAALLLTQLAIAAGLLAPFGLARLPEFSRDVVLLTLASGIFSMLGNLLLLAAYARAPATRLAPLVYLQLLAATALGWAVFGNLPDAWTWTGLAIVITAGLVSAGLRR